MRHITVENTSKRDFHQFMLGGVTPRPIALVSTISKDGIRNLAPYSYFNAVSSIPPVLMVSVGRKPDGSKKDTLVNIENTGEFVVNMVPFDLLMQMALSSVALPPESDEFDLAGLNTLESINIKPFRVAESPIHFECKLKRIIELGDGPGESTLILGDVQCIHVDEKIIGQNNRIDPGKLRIVGRLGRSYYTRTGTETLETVVITQKEIPIGFESLPEKIKTSTELSANEVAKLATCYQRPTEEEIKRIRSEIDQNYPGISDQQVIKEIGKLIREGKVTKALQLAFSV